LEKKNSKVAQNQKNEKVENPKTALKKIEFSKSTRNQKREKVL